MLFSRTKTTLPEADAALPGRSAAMPVAARHLVLGTPTSPPYPEGTEVAIFGTGCFWGAERKLWQLPGVYTTAVGYSGGYTPNPTYDEVCSGRTAHTEVVQVVFDPAVLPYRDLLIQFWLMHDPTQGMRQAGDIGTQYRSAVYVTTPDQRETAQATREEYGRAVAAAGYGPITTEIVDAGPFYFAEDYHQQYLAKNPHGYDCHSSTGVPFPKR